MIIIMMIMMMMMMMMMMIMIITIIIIFIQETHFTERWWRTNILFSFYRTFTRFLVI